MLIEILKYVMPSIFVIIGAIVGYFIQNRINRLQKIEENIRNLKFDLYKKLIEPYIFILAFPGNDTSYEFAINELSTLPYKRNYYNLKFIGSDQIIILFNELLELGNNARGDELNKVSKVEKSKIINVLGKLFLEIRKEYGVKTKLNPEEIMKLALKELEGSIDWANFRFDQKEN